MACLDMRKMSVSEIAEMIELPLPTVSQHLTALKSEHLVVARKKGVKVAYNATELFSDGDVFMK
jgi:DNA-binding transcriptional ArsR family regulator